MVVSCYKAFSMEMCFSYINGDSLSVDRIMEVEDGTVGYDKRVMWKTEY